MTNDGTASAWEPGGLMARGLRTRGIDTPSGWPRAQRRPGRRGRPATACAHALPTATPSPRAVRGWGRARARRAGKAGCPGLPLATGRPAPACCRPGHGGHVASGWRAVTPELPAWLLEHSIRLLRPPGGHAAGAPGGGRPTGSSRWPQGGCAWAPGRPSSRRSPTEACRLRLFPGVFILPVAGHLLRAALKPEPGTSPREQVPRRARPESV